MNKVRAKEPKKLEELERMAEIIPDGCPMQPIEPADYETLWKHADLAQAIVKVCMCTNQSPNFLFFFVFLFFFCVLVSLLFSFLEWRLALPCLVGRPLPLHFAFASGVGMEWCRSAMPTQRHSADVATNAHEFRPLT